MNNIEKQFISIKSLDNNVINKNVDHIENTNMKENKNIKIKKKENLERNEDIGKIEGINIEKNKNIDMEKNQEVSESSINLTDNILSNNSNNNDQNNTSNTENKCLQQSTMESIDFTADITLDQLDQQKDVTDEDVLHHLDEIENIVLDSTDFQLPEECTGNQLLEADMKNQSSNSENKLIKDNNTNENNNVDKKTLYILDKEIKQEIKEEECTENDWYEQKVIYD